MILSRTYRTHCAVTEGITVYPVAREISVKWAVNCCVQLLFYRNGCHYSQYNLNYIIIFPYRFKVTKDTVTISELTGWWSFPIKYTVQLKDADPNELQQFIDKMPASIKGKSVKYGF